ncbi:hypothetical protein DFH07DRAFT_774530 [Mycena maculata]|uniref:Uncharacterized protein n=1 Tax=Mycena maculata TaxID=230809 RepID=A0AAD7IWW5_9AGAR|nr:hypothetical protein DFH07DRAFT_774530 [Mycena maculata]
MVPRGRLLRRHPRAPARLDENPSKDRARRSRASYASPWQPPQVPSSQRPRLHLPPTAPTRIDKHATRRHRSAQLASLTLILPRVYSAPVLRTNAPEDRPCTIDAGFHALSRAIPARSAGQMTSAGKLLRKCEGNGFSKFVRREGAVGGHGLVEENLERHWQARTMASIRDGSLTPRIRNDDQKTSQHGRVRPRRRRASAASACIDTPPRRAQAEDTARRDGTPSRRSGATVQLARSTRSFMGQKDKDRRLGVVDDVRVGSSESAAKILAGSHTSRIRKTSSPPGDVHARAAVLRWATCAIREASDVRCVWDGGSLEIYRELRRIGIVFAIYCGIYEESIFRVTLISLLLLGASGGRVYEARNLMTHYSQRGRDLHDEEKAEAMLVTAL